MARDRSLWRQELVEQIAQEVHKRGWRVDVDGLVRAELALTLQALVAPGEPAAGVWALLRGYPLKQLPPAAEQALSVTRWLVGELKSEDAWKETLTDYLQAPEQVRAFVIDDPEQVAQARTPGIASDRHDVYSDALRRLPPHQVFEMPIAEAGQAYQVSAAGMDETIVIPDELPEPTKLARHLLPDHPKRRWIRIKWPELLAFAASLDEEDRAAGREDQRWHARLKDVRVRLRGKDSRFRRSQYLDFAHVHHLVGMVGAGKSTLMDVVAMWAARHSHTVTIVVADVVSALRRVELFNRYRCPAAPVLGASSRSRHVQQLHRPGARPVDGLTAMANPLLDWASTACALSVHRSVPGPWDVDDAPCMGLKQTTIGPRGGQSTVRHVCPFWGDCQRHRGSRALVDAKIWVATPAGLVYTHVPAPVIDYDLRYLEMAWHRSDLIIVDEADQVQAQLDGIFSPSQTLAGEGDDAWLDLIDIEKKRQLRLLGRGPIVQRKVARWNRMVDNADTLVSRIYSMLGTHPHLRAWVGDGYFNEWTLSVRLANSFAAKPATDPPRGGEGESAARIETELARSWRGSFAKWALRPTDPRKPCGDLRADELRQLCAETGYADDAAITQRLRTWLLARKDLHLPAAPTDRDQLVLRLQFTLLVGMLARLVSQITGSWSDVEAPLRMRGHGSSLVHRPPVEYAAVVPDSPMGNLIGFQYQHDDDARPDRLGSLRFFRCAGIGRWLLLNLANLYVDADTAPPGVLLLSATSWAGTSPRYDLQFEVTGLLEASDRELAGIHASRLHYSPQRYDNDHLIRVSGRNGADRTAALHAMTFALARSRDDGLGGHQPSVLERQRDALPPNRRRVLLVVGSYNESEDVEAALLKTRPEWDGQIVRLVPDDATFTHHWTGRTLARGSVHELRHTDAWILIAPMLSIERGHNILNSDNVAALGAVFFLVRPHPRPDDIAYHVQDVNRWGVEQIRGHLPAANDHISSDAPLHERMRKFIDIARSRWRQALASPLMLSAMSENEERSAFMWTQLVTIWQIIGRLVRGGQAAEVHFCDAAFDPSHPDSLLVGMRQVLGAAMADPATAELAKILYAPLQQALATLMEADHAL